MKKFFLIIVVFTFSLAALAQNLDQYKYALVPKKFSSLKDKNQYQLNTLAKLFMEKYGFETYIESESAPNEFLNIKCNKVFVDLEEDNTIFVTKIKVVLKDCYGNVLHTSKQGTSREKELRVAYNLALREAFSSLSSLNHKYVEKRVEEQPIEITQVKEVIQVPVDENKSNGITLYAQPIKNGFQLVNSQPKVIMMIYQTSVKNYFIANKDTLQGVLLAKDNEWFFEYYQNEKLISEKLDVKF